MILDTEKLKIRRGVLPGKKTTPKQGAGTDRFYEKRADNKRVLDIAMKYWMDLADWRARNYRNFMYLRGRQWHELVAYTDRDGRTFQMTEEDYIKTQGKIPFKQNLIRPIVKKIVSQYRSNPSKSMAIARSKENSSKSEMLTTMLQAELDVNESSELDARNLENYLISGAAIGKVGYKYIATLNRESLFLDNISQDRIFFNSGIKDSRLKEINFIGDIIDATRDDIIAAFAMNKDDEEAIKQLFNTQNSAYPGTGQSLSKEDTSVTDFMIPRDMNLCRIYECWEYKAEWRLYVHDYYDGTRQVLKTTKAQIDEINRQRIVYYAQNGVPADEVPLMVATEKYEQFWYVKYLTPTGACLFEGETPYQHEEHPYAMSLAIVNGEVWGAIEDMIDQQRFINRLIIAQEFARSAAAKGVLLVPEEAIPDDMTIEDFAEEWTKYNGVIKIKLKQGAQAPTQIVARAIDPDSNASIQMQMDFMMRTSGVGDAIQGISAKAGVSGTLYAQEAQNSATNNIDVTESYNAYKKRRDKKSLSIIRQYYEDRIITIAGKAYSNEAQMYKASEAKAMKDIDINIVQGADSPVFRSMIDDQLFKWVDTNKIDIETALAHCSIPFADNLLADIQRKRKEAEEAMAQQQQSQMQAQPPQQSPVQQ